MRIPTDDEWDRISQLVREFEQLDPDDRDSAVRAKEENGQEDSFILSHVKLKLKLQRHDRARIDEEVDGHTILEELGRGGMGVVYRARHQRTGREVALKVIPPESLEYLGEDRAELLRRFQNEVKTQANLECVGIARLYECGTFRDPQYDVDVPYFSMELVRGTNLLAWAEENRLGLFARLRLFCAICDAVQYAHERRVLHLDLKPANIRVGNDGQPRILDFGLAELLDPALANRAAWFMPGTAKYMSPEQVTDQYGPVTQASDQYSLGVVLYEFVSGRLPYEFDDTSPQAIRQTITEVTPARLSGLRRRFVWPVIARALRKEPCERYPSVSSLRDSVARLARVPKLAFSLLVTILVIFAIVGAVFWATSPLPLGVNEVAVRLFHHDSGTMPPDLPWRPLNVASQVVDSSDGLAIRVTINRPSYCYLIAFEPDGTHRLCFPSDPETPPVPAVAFRYPPNEDERDNFPAGTSGVRGYLLLVASSRLPSFAQWHGRHGNPDWRPIDYDHFVSFDGAFFNIDFHDWRDPETVESDGPPELFKNLCRFYVETGDFEVVKAEFIPVRQYPLVTRDRE